MIEFLSKVYILLFDHLGKTTESITTILKQVIFLALSLHNISLIIIQANMFHFIIIFALG